MANAVAGDSANDVDRRKDGLSQAGVHPPSPWRGLMLLLVGTATVGSVSFGALLLLGSWLRPAHLTQPPRAAEEIRAALDSRDVSLDPSTGNAGLEAYYFEHPSHAADATLLSALAEPGEKLCQVARPSSIQRGLSLMSGLGLAVAGLILVLLGLRHPLIGRRLLVLAPTLLLVSMVAFFAVSRPSSELLAARALQLTQVGDADSLQRLEELRAVYHWDESTPKRYARWVGAYWFSSFDDADRGLLQGRLGVSVESGRDIGESADSALAVTLPLCLAAMLLAWLLALPLGVLSATAERSRWKRWARGVAFSSMSIPAFVLAWGLLVAFGAVSSRPGGWGAQLGWVAVVLALPLAGTLARVMRDELSAELREPYVLQARARGLSSRQVLVRYPLRTALPAVVASMGRAIPQLISACVAVALVVALPGLGLMQVHASLAGDSPRAAAGLLALSLLSVFGMLFADLVTFLLDPRLRSGTSLRSA